MRGTAVPIVMLLVVTACADEDKSSPPTTRAAPAMATIVEESATTAPATNDPVTSEPETTQPSTTTPRPTTTLSPQRKVIADLQAAGFTLESLVAEGYINPGDSWDEAVGWLDNCDFWRESPTTAQSLLTSQYKVDVTRIVVGSLCPEHLPLVEAAAISTMTSEEFDALLGPPASAWLATPSGATYDALAATARSILDSGRPLPDEVLVDEPGWRTSELLSSLATYPGSDLDVVLTLDRLALPSVAVPFLLRTGSYLVGAEVPPGTYRAQNVESCYWETLDEAGEINDNNFVSAAPQVLMEVRPSDYAVNNDCALMVKVD